jgi:hypothetical protein
MLQADVTTAAEEYQLKLETKLSMVSLNSDDEKIHTTLAKSIMNIY